MNRRRLAALAHMCPPCVDAWMRWLDYRLPPAPVRLVQVGRPTEREIADHRQARLREWRETIQFEQDLIVRGCAAYAAYRALCEDQRPVAEVQLVGDVL